MGSLQHCGDVFTFVEALQQHAWDTHTHFVDGGALGHPKPKTQEQQVAAPKQATVDAAELR